jgi:hypothetical protein
MCPCGAMPPAPAPAQAQSQVSAQARCAEESRDLADKLAAQVESLAGALGAKTEAEQVWSVGRVGGM